MYKSLKFIYELGIRHERRRIKMLIAQHMRNKPEMPSGKDYDLHDISRGEYDRQMNVWLGVRDEMDKLVHPQYRIEERQVSLLDEEL